MEFDTVKLAGERVAGFLRLRVTVFRGAFTQPRHSAVVQVTDEKRRHAPMVSAPSPARPGPPQENESRQMSNAPNDLLSRDGGIARHRRVPR